MSVTWREKAIGRRIIRPRVSSYEALVWQTEAASLVGSDGICRRGVFRFKTFEEAEKWMTSEAARSARDRRRDKISHASPER